ncbi:MAG TPA: Clp protease N-terminal domain-containing protein [Bryobacteraceae bacterium]|nr:Clp protease N-terminal domain-containing protein [Bryobacteraceae bacterium]
MFEQYTETARRAVFFARYEVSQLGGPCMDTEHLLLGIFHADPPLTLRLLKTQAAIDAIRERIRKQSSHPEKSATTVDLPLSADCKRVLEHAADEAKRLNQDHIGPAHLLQGMLRETSGIALKILLDAGVTIPGLEQEAILRPPTRLGPGLPWQFPQAFTI